MWTKNELASFHFDAVIFVCEAITIDVIGSCQNRHFVLRVILIMKRIVNE